jgi:hypothetical protein
MPLGYGQFQERSAETGGEACWTARTIGLDVGATKNRKAGRQRFRSLSTEAVGVPRMEAGAILGTLWRSQQRGLACP